MEKAVLNVLPRTSASKDTSAVSSTVLFCEKDSCCYGDIVSTCSYDVNFRSSNCTCHVNCTCVCMCHVILTCVHTSVLWGAHVVCVMCVRAHMVVLMYVYICEWVNVPHSGLELLCV